MLRSHVAAIADPARSTPAEDCRRWRDHWLPSPHTPPVPNLRPRLRAATPLRLASRTERHPVLSRNNLVALRLETRGASVRDKLPAMRLAVAPAATSRAKRFHSASAIVGRSVPHAPLQEARVPSCCGV